MEIKDGHREREREREREPVCVHVCICACSCLPCPFLPLCRICLYENDHFHHGAEAMEVLAPHHQDIASHLPRVCVHLIAKKTKQVHVCKELRRGNIYTQMY